MRQIRIARPDAGIDGLDVVEVEKPAPGPGQVLVRMRAASLNYRDLMTVKGTYGGQPRRGLVPLSDGAGEVEAVGPGATLFKAGDRVCPIFCQSWLGGGLTAANTAAALGGTLDGVLSDYVVLHETGLVAIPDHLSFEEAATLPCAAVTAWHSLRHVGDVTAGDTVLVQGTGGVSVFALQFAKVMGARVIGTSSSDEKLERARGLGLDAAINYRTVPEWQDEVLRLTGGLGVDHVVEVGGAGTLARSIRAACCRRQHRHNRRADRQERDRPHGDPVPPRRAARRLRRLARDVRGDEPRHRAARDAPRCRQHLPVRAGARRVAPPRRRHAFRQDRDPVLKRMATEN